MGLGVVPKYVEGHCKMCTAHIEAIKASTAIKYRFHSLLGCRGSPIGSNSFFAWLSLECKVPSR